MYILVTYDINTMTPAGKKRLRHIAKICLNYGQRVQNSVFELKIDEAQLLVIENKLKIEIDPSSDSLRFYRLGDNYKVRVKHIGAKETYSMDEPLIL